VHSNKLSRFGGSFFIALFLLAGGHTTAQQSSSFNTLYEFQGPPDGYSPESGVIIGPGGVLYGTTYIGGSASKGTVFSLTPPASPGGAWTEAVIYNFENNKIGYNPYAGLTVGHGGTLFGITSQGGSAADGTVYQLHPPASSGESWTASVVFTGGFSFAAPLLASNDVLYLTSSAGAGGEICSLTPPVTRGDLWTETVLYTLAGGADGSDPGALTMGADGVLYGATFLGGTGCAPSGCGTVYSVTPPSAPGGTWTHTVLYSFAGGDGDGANPYFLGPLALDSNGVLYGTTDLGGTANQGVVYSLTPPATPGGAWTETVLYNFDSAGSAGSGTPSGVVIGAGDVLYGTNETGGINNDGTVYVLIPPASPGGTWTEKTLFTFSGSSEGRDPLGGLRLGASGLLYGTTLEGGLSETSCKGTCGTIFSLTP
jgi:uncharacterized repeat protein (TIGR03803 family)